MTALRHVTIFGVEVMWVWLIVGLLLVGTAIEAVVRVARRRGFDARDALVNVALYAGNVGILYLWAPFLFELYDRIYQHALFDLGVESALGPWIVGALLVVSEDLCYYAFHRASHRVRFLWAAHEPHHSSQSFNWSVALRQTWVPFVAAPFWFVLPLLGFDPLMVLSAQLTSLLFQALLHTELVGTLGPLGWIFNTPGHHRVHHSADEDQLDKNFGGIFIFWDRLFGTFHAGVPSRYGTEHTARTPLVAAFGEWGRLVRDVVRTRSLAIVLRPPGWSPPRSRS